MIAIFCIAIGKVQQTCHLAQWVNDHLLATKITDKWQLRIRPFFSLLLKFLIFPFDQLGKLTSEGGRQL